MPKRKKWGAMGAPKSAKRKKWMNKLRSAKRGVALTRKVKKRRK